MSACSACVNVDAVGHLTCDAAAVIWSADCFPPCYAYSMMVQTADQNTCVGAAQQHRLLGNSMAS